MKWKRFIVTVDFEVKESLDIEAKRIVKLALDDVVEYSFFIKGYEIKGVREKKEKKEE